MDVTLLELHLPNAEFNAPFSSGSRPSADAAAAGEADADPSTAARLGPVAALLGLVGLALLARHLRGGEADQTRLDEIEASDAS